MFYIHWRDKRCAYESAHSCMTTACACCPTSVGGSRVTMLEGMVIFEAPPLLLSKQF